MSQRTYDRAQMRRRAAGGAIQNLLWTLAAIGSVSVLGIATASALGELRVPKAATFLGHLEDTAQALELDLPKGIAVKAIMVRNGLTVTKGQPLVRLDAVSIANAHRQAEANLVAERQLLACLNAAVMSFSPMHSEEAARLSVPALTTPGCDDKTGPWRRAVKELDASDAVLALRSMLIDRRIKLELANLQSVSAGRDKPVRLILGLAWAQTRIEDMHADSLKLRGKMMKEAAAALTEDMRVAAASLKRTETELAYLSQLKRDPTLVSPEDATVLQTKPTAQGQAFDVQTALISLVPTGGQRFVVHASVPASKEPDLQEDALVRIELIGTATRLPALMGHVISLQSGSALQDDSMWQVRIALEPESEAILLEMSANSSFVGDGAPVEMNAIGTEEDLGSAMFMALAQSLPGQM
jgi:multidrug efflux pump subunit AcrA (membrane-fusion protein)